MSESIPALTRRALQCPTCKARYTRYYPLSEETPHLHCPVDGALLRRYFGREDAPPINYGFRPSRYYTKADEDIANYQFTNL